MQTPAASLPTPAIAPALAGANRYRLATITTTRDFLALESEWNALLARATSSSCFQSFEFLFTWWRCHGSDRQLAVLVARDAGKLVGIAPLMRERRSIPYLPLRYDEIRFVGTVPNPYSPRSFTGTLDLLIDPTHEAAREALVRGLLTCLGHPNAFRLHPLPETSPTFAVFQRAGQDLGLEIHTRKVFDNAVVRIEQDWEGYLGDRSGKFRYNLRRLHRRLYEEHGAVCVEYRHPEKIDEAIRQMLHVEAKSWKFSGGIALADRSLCDFYSELTRALSSSGRLGLFIMTVDDQPIAYNLTADYHGHVIGLKTGYDRSWAKCSPGTLLQQRVFERAFQAGATDFDMLWGDLTYKRKWATDLESRHEIYLYGADRYSQLIRSLKTNPLLEHGYEWLRKVADRISRS